MVTIGTTARKTGISIGTLRFYEEKGLITPNRNASKQRIYTEEQISLLTFIRYLRQSGMPINTIHYYLQLAAAGPETLSERQAILQRQKTNILSEIDEKQHELAAINFKIAKNENERAAFRLENNI